MKLNLISALVLASSSLIVGCSGSSSSGDPESSADAVMAATGTPAAEVKAYLEAKPIKGAVGGLNVNVTSVAVVTPSNLPIGEKISAKLPQKPADFAFLGESGNVSGDVTPSLNEDGVLSLTLSVDIDSVSHPLVRTSTFDLATGELIALEHALSPEGLRVVQTACEATLKENDGNVAACASSLRPGQGAGGASAPVAYTVSKSGISFMPRDAAFVDFANGVDVAWSKLEGKIVNASLKALAEKQR